MKIKLKENLSVIVERHPCYESINKKLMEQINHLSFENPDQLHYYTNIRGNQYSFDAHKADTGPTIKLIENWVKELIAINFQRNLEFPLENYSFWFSKLNDEKGQLTYAHHHLCNATFAVVYFVNTPKGSSPLVFSTSGKKIKAEEGKVVIFPASLRHEVPQNRCKDRVVLAGNIRFLT